MSRKIYYIDPESYERKHFADNYKPKKVPAFWPWVTVGIFLWLTYFYMDEIIIYIFDLSDKLNKMLGVV